MSKAKVKRSVKPGSIQSKVDRISYPNLPIAGAALLVLNATGLADTRLEIVGALLCAGVLVDIAVTLIKVALIVLGGAFLAAFLAAWLICSKIVTAVGGLFKKGKS